MDLNNKQQINGQILQYFLNNNHKHINLFLKRCMLWGQAKMMSVWIETTVNCLYTIH